jgi:hypothetical protein
MTIMAGITEQELTLVQAGELMVTVDDATNRMASSGRGTRCWRD